MKANALRVVRHDELQERPETDLLSELIGLIYDAARDPALWPRALKQTCLFVGGSSGNLFWHDVATGRSAVLHVSDEHLHPAELDFDEYLRLNPCFPAATFVETGQVYGASDLVPFEDMVKTRFYR
ncbi:hypothetical protein VSR17_30745, partial [Cupriavidus taiwanensis]|uniref:hypothetical protein n=1 Tax=Cupriavidus taiwanensis TaxID=164546 RepID=UPI00317A91A3